VIVAHFTGDDLSSAALTFGLAFVFLSWRAFTRGRRRDTLRFGSLGVGAFVVGVIASVTH
jgi:hypothetical protein